MQDDHSIEREPHLQPHPRQIDPSEAKAEQELSGEEGDKEGQPHSIYDEPAVLPGQEGKPILRDWSCSSCGYNLRGLTTGRRCPECGHIEVYHPPPEEKESYGQWFERQRSAVTPGQSWAAVIVAAVIGGPFAIVGALMIFPSPAWLMLIVIGPTTEEMMKIAAICLVIEVKPYIIRHPNQIIAAGVLSAFVFAVIENILYVKIYMATPLPTIIAWRWVVCTSLHVGCTAICSFGLLKVWQRTVDEQRPPRLSGAVPLFTLAIILHGAYNATVTALSWAGMLF